MVRSIRVLETYLFTLLGGIKMDIDKLSEKELTAKFTPYIASEPADFPNVDSLMNTQLHICAALAIPLHTRADWCWLVDIYGDCERRYKKRLKKRTKFRRQRFAIAKWRANR